MRLPYHTLDVFTQSRFCGNPLSVVHQADQLSDAQMQTIAREFNLSETVFLSAPHNPVHAARARIFTPQSEVPFAGHPTIGAAIALALSEAPKLLTTRDMTIMIEEEIGVLECTVRHRQGQTPAATFHLLDAPVEENWAPDPERLARALHLSAADIGFDWHQACCLSAGLGFTFVPVRSLEAIAQAKPDMSHWMEGMGPEGFKNAFVYTRETLTQDVHFHCRMFAPLLGIMEDPATGSAAAAFSGLIERFEKPADGEHIYLLEQGHEMNRPSLMALTVDIALGELTGAAIGGHAVQVMQGEIEV
jgi:trans-2,3-dihydro-3-hydroxyanthranilate isomerase